MNENKSLRVDRGVAMAALPPGVMTMEGVRASRERLVDALGDGERVTGLLLDCRRPIWLATAQQLSYPSGHRGALLVLPVALVVTQAAAPIFQRYAWEMALLGLMRKAFTDPGSAQEWLLLRQSLSWRTAP